MKQTKLIDRKTLLKSIKEKNVQKISRLWTEKSEKIDVVENLVCPIERKTTKKSDELNTTHQKPKLKTVFQDVCLSLWICLLKISKDKLSYESKAESLNSVAYKHSKVSNKTFSVNPLFAWRSLLTFHQDIGSQMLIQLMSYANI